MTQRPITLPERPDPYTVASTMKCVACGAPYEAARALAPNAARGPFAPAMSSHACKCGSNTFGGSVGYDSPSPAQFTAAQLDAYARAAVEADREASRSLLDLLREQEEILAELLDQMHHFANADQRLWDESQRDPESFKSWVRSRAAHLLAKFTDRAAAEATGVTP